ncbi:acyltransferase family protein [Sphingobacterium wenxiniae]|uniref:Peptidoglycan/LPS O-acetylase OafA/YrhL, contains acyltransferase and SGNH-hydrolase domains n=1 Tax=Sphingobacterium wenxiniae TaxID=683125 RepID=A0A1I6Q5D4_9SPHI|nr:acyltransferase [Sphingobacterium wenxiniae]SFS47699.1 Peptidoglycan/LPS O-acetylase OafA/YrhL, contains acyltransferase and SGNH-hydrolase domains [Sphingobacterium wenxiniae]
MIQTETPSSAFVDSKPHYTILDGLRGVAALMVLGYHIFEAFATSHIDQHINHGYLAVDFFFLLSGFVIAYAYDERWKKNTITLKGFLKRRLIRLHPMVVIGAIIGAFMFYFQGCEVWDVSVVPVTLLLVSTMLNALLIPVTTGFEIRGVGEMYPLNGPSWSLFFEYIGNILYVLFLRLLPTRALAVLVFLAGCGLASFAIFGPLGDLGAGFAMTENDILGGSLRLLFSFSAGLLLSRIFRPTKIKGAFWIGSLVLITICAIPRIGGYDHLWMNGLYDSICVILIFPLLVYIGASGTLTGKTATRVCKFLGDISYPLYMVHYPFIYLYFAWVKNENLTFVESLPGAVAVVVGSVLLAYLCLKFYDIPVRRYLTRRFLK